MRRIISKVVVEPSADGKSSDLSIHGHLAAIMAAQEAIVLCQATRPFEPQVPDSTRLYCGATSRSPDDLPLTP